MRTVAPIAIFAVLVGVSCSVFKPAVIPAKWSTWDKAALDTLTETDIADFVRLLPRFSGALKAAGWKLDLGEPGIGPARYEIHYVESMNVPGVDDSLKAAGSSWSTMRSLMYRVFAAMYAWNVVTNVPSTIEQVSKDTIASRKKDLKNLHAYLAISAQIPKVNIELVPEHMKELVAIQKLGR